VTVEDYGGWRFFIGDASRFSLYPDKVGKWMFFFSTPQGRDFAERMCGEAVKTHVCEEAKRADSNKGVACFYTLIDDYDSHRRIISFFLRNNMIGRTKTGRLQNLSFKLDFQTYAGSYGSDFTAPLKLSELIDLNTGEWLH